MLQPNLVIRNGTVVNATGSVVADVAIANGKIVALANPIDLSACPELDASGKLVFPGFIDAHTHMGIPIMNTHSCDDFESGSIAAACGGVTSIIDFTVQEAGQTLRDAVEARIAKAMQKSHIDFGLHVNVTDQPARRLQEIEQLIAEGFTAFKVFSTYRQAGMMISWPDFRSVLQTVDANGGLLFLHAEDNDLVESQTESNVSAGHRQAIYHARSRTAAAEAKAIAQAASIALALDARLYIVHLSSKAGLEAALEARARGAKLILETCPQYLVLTEELYHRENGHRWITTPPLRTKTDSEALWRAIANGDIDVVATDHCPFTLAQKEAGHGAFHETPNGIPGAETLFPLLYTYGVAHDRIQIERLVSLLSTKPAEIFGLSERKGTIKVGADADVVIWDPLVMQTISDASCHGNADWSPYQGSVIAGKVDHVLLSGQFLVEKGHFVGRNVWGRLLQPN